MYRPVTEPPATRARSPQRRIAAAAGRTAPVVFAAGLVAITWAQWDYLRGLGFTITDHGDSAWPSGLAQGPLGWAQMLNFAVFGVLVLVFYAGLRQQFTRRRSRRVATTLLTLSGLGWLLVAFPEDGPPFGNPSTWAGYLHGIGFVCLVLFTTAGMAATAVALQGRPDWRGYPLVSLVAAAGTFTFLVVLVFVLEKATTLGIYGFFATTLAWVTVMAKRLRALD